MSRLTWQRTAESWVTKVTTHHMWDARNGTEDQRWLIGYDAAHFARVLLDAVDSLVPLLNADQPEERDELRKLAVRIAQRLRDRALAEKMSNTAGRTPEESAAFERKADELRARS